MLRYNLQLVFQSVDLEGVLGISEKKMINFYD